MNSIVVLLSLFALLPTEEIQRDNYLVDRANTRASISLVREIYGDLADVNYSFKVSTEAIDGLDITFEDGSLCWFIHSYENKRLKITVHVMVKGLHRVYSILCKYEMNEDEEESFKNLVMWHCVCLFSSSETLMKEVFEKNYYYPVEKICHP